MIRKLLSIVLIFIVIASCKNKDVKSTDTSGKLYDLKLQLGDSQKIYYTSGTETILKQEIEGEEIENINKINTATLYSIKKDSSGLYNFEIRYKHFNVYVKTNEMEKELDADSAENYYDPADRILAIFKNAVVTAKVTKQGEVRSINGVNELTNKMYELANGNSRAIESIKTSAGKLLSADMYRSTIQKTFNTYPDKAVAIGESWKKSDTIQAEFAIPVTTLYTLESVQNGIAVISISSEIDLHDQQLKVEGYTAVAELKGEQKGTLKIDTNTGLVQSNKNTNKIKGELEVMGKKIPISFEINSFIEAQKQ